MERQLYAYEYAEVAFDDAVELLAEDAGRLLQEATDSSVRHTEDIVARISVELAGVEVGRQVTIEAGPFEPLEMLRGRLPLRWHATESPGLFPAVTAHLEVAALALRPPRTQVTLVGTYDPPLGWPGAVIDAAMGHRIAEAAVHRFVGSVARRLEEAAETAPSTAGARP